MNTVVQILIIAGVVIAFGGLLYLMHLITRNKQAYQYIEAAYTELLQRETEVDNKEQSVRSAYQFQGEEKLRLDQQQQAITNLIQQNQAILRSNQMYLYGIKENMLDMISDYRKACKLMNKSMYGEDSLEKKHEHLTAMSLKILALEDHFISNFKMTPQQYRDQKRIGNTNCSAN